MVADTASIRAELEGLHNLPTPVREWRVEEGLDATDDPAVWVWAMIENDDVDADSLRHLKAMARSVVRDATGLWAYILIRGADEKRSYRVSLPRDLLAQAALLARGSELEGNLPHRSGCDHHRRCVRQEDRQDAVTK